MGDPSKTYMMSLSRGHPGKISYLKKYIKIIALDTYHRRWRCTLSGGTRSSHLFENFQQNNNCPINFIFFSHKSSMPPPCLICHHPTPFLLCRKRLQQSQNLWSWVRTAEGSREQKSGPVRCKRTWRNSEKWPHSMLNQRSSQKIDRLSGRGAHGLSLVSVAN